MAGTVGGGRTCEVVGCQRQAEPGRRLCAACRKSLLRRGRPSPGTHREEAFAEHLAAAYALEAVGAEETNDALFQTALARFRRTFRAAAQQALEDGELNLARLMSPNARRIRRS